MQVTLCKTSQPFCPCWHCGTHQQVLQERMKRNSRAGSPGGAVATPEESKRRVTPEVAFPKMDLRYLTKNIGGIIIHVT